MYKSVKQVLHETKSLYVNNDLEICLNNGTHSVVVGKAKSLYQAIRFCERSEKNNNIQDLKKQTLESLKDD
jgi:malonyl CoA-acyl carrier protein transacylase